MGLYNKNYAIQLLQEQLQIFEAILKDRCFDGYTEALKDRTKKKEELKKAISVLMKAEEPKPSNEEIIKSHAPDWELWHTHCKTNVLNAMQEIRVNN